jgi:hypothetical protein
MAEETDAPPAALILGVTSDIGRAAAQQFAAAGYALQLAGRRREAVQRERDDLAVRTAGPVTMHVLDVTDSAAHAAFLDSLDPLPEVAVCVVGTMGDQAENERDPAKAAQVIAATYTAPAQLLGELANRFAARGHGTIVGVSSVAGDRGRATNYVYGSAKAGFTAFLSGLRNRFAGTGVHVATIKPGFVRTRMTAGLKLPGPLTASPDRLGRSIHAAVAKRRNVVYVLPVWRLVMLIIRAIPEPVFKRLRL